MKLSENVRTMRIQKGNFYLNGHFFDYALLDESGQILLVCNSKDVLLAIV